MSTGQFGDRFITRARQYGNPLCVGLDPHLAAIPAEFGVLAASPSSERTARGVLAFFSDVIEACAGVVPVVKPQISLFEQMGWRGLQVLEELAAAARAKGLLVLLDAKRGENALSTGGYVRAYLLPDSPCRVDAMTVNPYLGLDSLAPFFEASRVSGAGIFVLAKTSNAGARDFQECLIDGVPLFEHVAAALSPHADTLLGEQAWSNLGVVAGATFPEQAARLRKILPRSLFLIPGFGAQGANAASALASFVPGARALEGGLVSSSRGILFGDGPTPGDSRAALRTRLAHAVAELSAATRQGSPATQ